MPAAAAERAWSEWVAGGDDPVEGLVVVALQSRLGKGKRKVKMTDTIDAICVASDDTGHVLRVRGSEQLVVVGPRQPILVNVGETYELAHEGRFAGGSYRFARLVRARPDLSMERAGYEPETLRA